MIRPRYLPPDACFDDPAENIDAKTCGNDQPSPFALAAQGLVCIKKWAAHGDTKQRALRADLVTLSMCPERLPCKRPSAAWCGRQHGVSREYANRLYREFASRFGDYIQFRGQRFLNRASTP